MGKSTKQTNTTTADPTTLARERQMWNSANKLAQNPFQAYDPNSRVAGMTPLMQQGAAALPGAVTAGQPAMNAGISAAMGAANYDPRMIEAAQAAAAQGVGGDAIQQFLAMSGGGGSVSARDVTSLDAAAKMGQYINPYESQVVNAALGDVETARQKAIAAGQARATAAGAYGGSRHGIADAETNKAAIEQAAETASQLRMAGFNTAAGLGAQDATRDLQGQTANQGADVASGTANLNAGLSRFSGLLNAGMFNAGQANQVGMFNAGQTNQIAAQNQQAGLTGNAQRLGAGQALGALGAQQQNMGIAGADALYRGGQIEQGINQGRANAAYEEFQRQQAFPYQQLAFLQGFRGTPGQVNTQTQQGSALGGILGAAATIAGGPIGGAIASGVGGLFGGGGSPAAASGGYGGPSSYFQNALSNSAGQMLPGLR